MHKLKNTVVGFVLLFSTWLLLAGTLSLPYLILGAFISAIIAVAICPTCEGLGAIRLNPKALAFLLIYLLVFFKELVLANLDVAKRA